MTDDETTDTSDSKDDNDSVFDVFCEDENGDNVVCHETGKDIWEVKEELEKEGMTVKHYSDSDDD